jgi:hypothetical protein
MTAVCDGCVWLPQKVRRDEVIARAC